MFRRISLADLLQLMVAHAEDVEAASQIPYESEGDSNEAEVPIKYRDEVENVVHKMDQLEVCYNVDISCPFQQLWSHYNFHKCRVNYEVKN